MSLSLIAPALTGNRIDRADQVRVDPDRLAGYMNWKAKVLSLNGLEPEVDFEGRLVWRSLADAAPDSELIFLGLIDEKAHFAELKRGERGSGLHYNPRVWQMLSALPADELALYGGARTLVDWHARHRFCSLCGAASAMSKGGWSRTCTGCGAEHFPRVDPVTIMLAEYQGKVLLGRQPRFPPRRFSALAGFVEPGEGIEEAVARELWEEAGVRVRNVRYVASQPWPFPSSLMIACTSEALSDELTLDTTEIEEAGWFSAAEVRAAMAGDESAPFIAPPPFAIAHDLLKYYLSQQ
ncbi:NAD(+) diphosphatase [Sphingomonas ursincola]|uniref:NAD(+) diphosphatase n=1 Tax=Sphingomonas ursincola TaxID=56361 RepID=A0A7V8U7U1_9SPHN|nr:NAD(+) diphosphatase [Sphingomonas ursincola]MBA1373358.1 NAD(+) diphosphatase [Sphingomonas ursincola]